MEHSFSVFNERDIMDMILIEVLNFPNMPFFLIDGNDHDILAIQWNVSRRCVLRYLLGEFQVR